ncbi:hypothetical protein C7S14_3917 [Burkholderia cepacia]|nr:hypothetical protein C7S14_3917 [Burkholderia cepacia]
MRPERWADRCIIGVWAMTRRPARRSPFRIGRRTAWTECAGVCRLERARG